MQQEWSGRGTRHWAALNARSRLTGMSSAWYWEAGPEIRWGPNQKGPKHHDKDLGWPLCSGPGRWLKSLKEGMVKIIFWFWNDHFSWKVGHPKPTCFSFWTNYIFRHAWKMSPLLSANSFLHKVLMRSEIPNYSIIWRWYLNNVGCCSGNKS